MIRASAKSRGAIVAIGLASLAPTVGDVGACGKDAIELAPASFAASKKEIDCERCKECEIATARCARACDLGARPEDTIPAGCRPLVHDGEVCARALRSASCEDFAAFVADDARRVPTECEFCRRPSPASSGFGDDGGAL